VRLLLLILQQTVEVIALLQLTPVLVDVDLYNMNISIDRIKAAITPKSYRPSTFIWPCSKYGGSHDFSQRTQFICN
jgi:dTDP-4-amino-4,6-dideoxygalactose transaminase